MIDRLEHWRAPENSTIPDFIICGAAKAGTTTLHSILDEHPDVFIPKNFETGYVLTRLSDFLIMNKSLYIILILV